METLVTNKRLSTTIRILLVLFILISVSILVIKVRGIVKLNNAYKASEGIFKETVPDSPEKELGAKDALVWLAAGGRAVMLEGDFRDILYNCSNPYNMKQLSPVQVEKIEALFAANEPAMMLLHRAEGLEPGMNPHIWTGTGGLYALYTSRLLALEARVAIAKGDYKRFLSAAQLLAVWTEALQGKPWTAELDDSSLALGLSAEAMLTGIVHEAVETPGFSSNFTAEAEKIIPGSDPLKSWRCYVHTIARKLEEGDREWLQLFEGGDFTDDSLFARTNRYLFTNFIKAEFINYSRELVLSSRKPFDKLPKADEATQDWSWQYIFLGKIKFVLAERRLMEAALRAVASMNSTGRWPNKSALGLDQNPWTINDYICKTGADGTLTISCEGLQELYKSWMKQSPFGVEEKWELKAVKTKK
jgi:hypothetical protein